MKTANKEAFKEVMRWFIFLLVSGFVSMIPFAPTHLIPEQVVLLGITLPLQNIVVLYVIPSVLRFLDKYKHENAKERYETQGESLGIVPF